MIADARLSPVYSGGSGIVRRPRKRSGVQWWLGCDRHQPFSSVDYLLQVLHASVRSPPNCCLTRATTCTQPALQRRHDLRPLANVKVDSENVETIIDEVSGTKCKVHAAVRPRWPKAASGRLRLRTSGKLTVTL
jgi:hypothetical protein